MQAEESHTRNEEHRVHGCFAPCALGVYCTFWLPCHNFLSAKGDAAGAGDDARTSWLRVMIFLSIIGDETGCWADPVPNRENRQRHRHRHRHRHRRTGTGTVPRRMSACAHPSQHHGNVVCSLHTSAPPPHTPTRAQTHCRRLPLYLLCVICRPRCRSYFESGARHVSSSARLCTGSC